METTIISVIVNSTKHMGAKQHNISDNLRECQYIHVSFNKEI